VADLADVYGDAAPDLFDGLENAVTTADTLNEQHAKFDETMLASIGVGNTGADILERGGPYLVRSTADLVSTSEVLDYNSPALFCSIKTSTMSSPSFPRPWAATGFREGASAPSWTPAIPTSIPTICRG
jgi:phospholipid/cholesterol/gamma-HCH transport system substrate-binding protein